MKEFDFEGYLAQTRSLIADAEKAKAIRDGERIINESDIDENEESPHLRRSGRWQGKKALKFAYQQMETDAKQMVGMRRGLYRAKVFPDKGEILFKVTQRKSRAGA